MNLSPAVCCFAFAITGCQVVLFQHAIVLCVKLHVALLNRLHDNSMSALAGTVAWNFTVSQ